MLPIRITALCALACCLTAAYGQENFNSFNDAMNAGARLVRDQQYAASQAPLEAALKLAADDRQRLRAYQALLPAYRQLPEIDKMLEAQEFIIRHTERWAGRSLAARDLASFLHQRGKTDTGIQRYEARLKEDAKDIAAVSVLAVIYTRTKRDPQRGPELTGRLEALDRELSVALAQRLEQDAQAAPQTAASLLKDAATVWLEAGDKAKALAAAKKSLDSLPESRSDILVLQWREGLGDVLLETGEPQLAAIQFEAALAATSNPALRRGPEKKLAQAKDAAAKKP
jgi:tetratricopeptide (TPR) repeat protein